tara:strand:+ start:98509 stop:98826 length:318 start_codon:yes stop_codon:yes gene_type:complete
MHDASCSVWWRTWLAAVFLYLAEGRAAVKGEADHDPHLKINESSMMFYEMSVKVYEAQRYARRHSEAVAVCLRKSLSTQRLLWCEFPQVAACLLMLMLFAPCARR